MIISSVTPAAVATSVWSSATRTLTSIVGSGTLVSATAANLAASAQLDLRPAAGKLRELTVAVIAGAAGSCNINLYDGSFFKTCATAATGAQLGFTSVGNATVGAALKNNDAANAATYEYCGIDWS